MLTIYDYIGANKRKTAIIILLFPLVLAVLVYLTLFFLTYIAYQQGSPYTVIELTNHTAMQIMPIVAAVVFIWLLISWFTGDKIMMATAGAHEIKREHNPEVYSIVENVARSAGLPMPQVFIMQDASLNAFATGRSPEHSAVALTSGIIKRLNRSELEAVIAHEMAHIGNRDVAMQMIVITGIGIITMIGQLMFRVGITMRGRKNNPGPIIALVGIVLMLYGLFLAPIILYALSRRREYQADATGAIITRNPGALANALEKISGDSRVEALDGMGLMSAACIADASKKSLDRGDAKQETAGGGFMSFISNLYSTHPPVGDRIKTLRAMDRDTYYQ